MRVANESGQEEEFQKGVAMVTESTGKVASPQPVTQVEIDVGVSASLLQHLSQTYYEVITTFERFMGMSRARWAILKRLSDEENVTQALLAQRLHVDAAAITRQVKQLETEGLVTRWPHPADNRFTVVALTAQGRDFVEERRGERDAFQETVTAGLTAEDVEHMQRCLSHMRHNAETLALKLDAKQ